MGFLCLLPLLLLWTTSAICMEEAVNDTELQGNSSDPNKDMYVIHAMVYQVGILTNKTDNETGNINTTGNQEAVTFYRTNGSQVDLSNIPTPLLTNVTAHSLVGVAPIPTNSENGSNTLPWSTVNHPAGIPPSFTNKDSEPLISPGRFIRSSDLVDSELYLNDFYKSLFKRDAPVEKTPVSIHSGAAVIPQAAGVHSIALPPLLTLNNNLSNIPVPIPNTSVVHYAKINTLITKP